MGTRGRETNNMCYETMLGEETQISTSLNSNRGDPLTQATGQPHYTYTLQSTDSIIKMNNVSRTQVEEVDVAKALAGVQVLKQIFPEFSTEQIHQTLVESNFDYKTATSLLLSRDADFGATEAELNQAVNEEPDPFTHELSSNDANSDSMVYSEDGQYNETDIHTLSESYPFVDLDAIRSVYVSEGCQLDSASEALFDWMAMQTISKEAEAALTAKLIEAIAKEDEKLLKLEARDHQLAKKLSTELNAAAAAEAMHVECHDDLRYAQYLQSQMESSEQSKRDRELAERLAAQEAAARKHDSAKDLAFALSLLQDDQQQRLKRQTSTDSDRELALRLSQELNQFKQSDADLHVVDVKTNCIETYEELETMQGLFPCTPRAELHQSLVFHDNNLQKTADFVYRSLENSDLSTELQKLQEARKQQQTIHETTNLGPNVWSKDNQMPSNPNGSHDSEFPALSRPSDRNTRKEFSWKQGLETSQNLQLDYLIERFSFLRSEHVAAMFLGNKMSVSDTEKALCRFFRKECLTHNLNSAFICQKKSFDQDSSWKYAPTTFSYSPNPTVRVSNEDHLNFYSSSTSFKGLTLQALLHKFEPLLLMDRKLPQFSQTTRALQDRATMQREKAANISRRIGSLVEESATSESANSATKNLGYAVLANKRIEYREIQQQASQDAACIILILNNLSVATRLLKSFQSGKSVFRNRPRHDEVQIDMHFLTQTECRFLLDLLLQGLITFQVPRCRVISGFGNHSGAQGPKLVNLISAYLQQLKKNGELTQIQGRKGHFDINFARR